MAVYLHELLPLDPHTRAWRVYPCRVTACLRCSKVGAGSTVAWIAEPD
jgi:hypothetical protein